jgi:hypothetical protein
MQPSHDPDHDAGYVPPDPSAFRFDFDDVVRVASDDPELAPVNGERGVIVGRGEDASQPGYAVFIYSIQRVWCVEEHEIRPTGERDPRPAPTTALRVSVDEEGRGNIIGIRKL